MRTGSPEQPLLLFLNVERLMFPIGMPVLCGTVMTIPVCLSSSPATSGGALRRRQPARCLLALLEDGCVLTLIMAIAGAKTVFGSMASAIAALWKCLY